MPVRIWGAVAAPTAPGRHPLVIVAHGSHPDGCPGEFGTWPCFDTEQRNDLGLAHVVRALASAGFVAIAPDMNAAYTGGWGEPANALRSGQILDATLAAVGAADAGGPSLGLPLEGRADVARVGLLGHSRSGAFVERWARGRGDVRSLLLLAPAFIPPVGIADRPTTVVLGTCDGDTGLQGDRYLGPARMRGRSTSVTRILVTGATHNAYNRTLVRLRNDDAAPAGWQRTTRVTRIYGLRVQVTRIRGGR